jgi:regulator of nucleoside diphosphate kinase
MGEINKAEIVPDEPEDLPSFATIGSWVTYSTIWGVPRRTVQLVWPDAGQADPAESLCRPFWEPYCCSPAPGLS